MTDLSGRMADAELRNVDLARLAGTTEMAVAHWKAGRRPTPAYVYRLIEMYLMLPKTKRAKLIAR